MQHILSFLYFCHDNFLSDPKLSESGNGQPRSDDDDGDEEWDRFMPRSASIPERFEG